MNFFLVGVHFTRRSSDAEARTQKLIRKLTRRFPNLNGRVSAVPFFPPPVAGLIIFPGQEISLTQEEIRQALRELGFESTVNQLSSNSDPSEPDTPVDPESIRLLESGKSFCRLGLLEEARIQLQQAIQRDPSCLDAYHYLAAVLRRQSKTGEALHWLHLGLQTLPDQASIQFLCAELLSELGRMDEAVDHLKEAIRLKPEASSPYVKLGEVFQRLGQHNQARLAFEEGLARNPNSADAAAGLGSLCLGEGRLNQAIDYLQKALAENSSLHESRLQLGWCLFHTGRPHQAEVEFLTVAREGGPAFEVPAKFSLGRLYSHLEDFETSAQLLGEVIRQEPELAEAQHLLAQALCEMGEFEQALSHWKISLKLQPQREMELRPQLALCYSRLGNQREAARLTRKSLEELGPRANLYELLASIHMAEDEWELALATLRKGEVLEPDSALISFQLGWCHENLGQSQPAEDYYSRALRLDPGLIEAYSGLGWLYYARAQYDVALVLFEKALELDPTNPEMADHVGWVHLLLKQPGIALEHFQRALKIEPYSDFYRVHQAAAYLHLGRLEDCRYLLECLQLEPLDEFLANFAEYLMHQVQTQLGLPSKAISARKLKLLPEEFVTLTSSGHKRSSSKKWTEFRGKKGESEQSKKRLSR